MILAVSIARAETRGSRMVRQLVFERPERQAVWDALSAEDRELMVTWLGLARWSWISRGRRRRVEVALDLDAEALHQVLHTPGDVVGPSGDGFAPF